MTTLFTNDEYCDFDENFETVLLEEEFKNSTIQTKFTIAGKVNLGFLFPISSERILGRGFYRLTDPTNNNDSTYHIPVLLDEVLFWILVDTKGVYLDCTLGGGAHAEAILRRLTSSAIYLGMDQDQEAIQFASNRLYEFSSQLRLAKTNFSELSLFLEEQKIDKVDGILMDLGISSHQIDSPNRGFSFMREGPLDMRFDSNNKISASQIVNSCGEKELAQIFFEYGEEKQSRAIARQIVREREKRSIESTIDLAGIVKRVIRPTQMNKSLARIFQAIRIEVNKEMLHLRRVLESSLDHLKVGGRLVVISYHSLEDRLIKQFFRANVKRCVCPPQLPVCSCNQPGKLKILTKKPIIPGKEEILQNPRSRSAKLRVAERI